MNHPPPIPQQKAPPPCGGTRNASPSSVRPAGFTILEMLVATTVLILILGMVLSMISHTSLVTRRATSKISAFQGARAAFDLMTKTMGQATLNSYWDYVDSGGNFLTSANAAGFIPANYARRSELHFLIGTAGTTPFAGTAGTGQAIYFQAPAGRSTGFDRLETLLDAVGYFITYENETVLPAPFSSTDSKYRYRLMQAIQPAEELAVYAGTTGAPWVTDVKNFAVPLAENIIYMAAWPRKAPTEDPQGAVLTSAYSYDSRANAQSASQPETANQMPPMVQVTIVAMDEASAARVCTGSTPPAVISGALSGLFQTSNQATFDADINTLKGRLDTAKINYRIFTATIPIRESKMQ